MQTLFPSPVSGLSPHSGPQNRAAVGRWAVKSPFIGLSN